MSSSTEQQGSRGHRKRRRWGDRVDVVPSTSTESSSSVGKNTGITDHAAAEALMSSAVSAQEKKDAEVNKRKQSNKRPKGHHGEGRQSQSRFDDENQKRGQQETGNGGDSNQNLEQQPPTAKPNFGLTGILATDEGSSSGKGGGGGNVYKGVVLKFTEPAEARAPNTQWRLYVFKKDELNETLHIAKQSAYLIGRANATNPKDTIADIPLHHPSISTQHAVIQYRALPHKETGRLNCQPYIMDLESTNKTFLNGVEIDSARYYQLKRGDVLKFGGSTREYVLMTEHTSSIK